MDDLHCDYRMRVDAALYYAVLKRSLGKGRFYEMN